MTKKDSQRSQRINLFASLICGAAQAGLFNPYDRALYLSVRDRTPFFHSNNWIHPYQGFSQAVVQRTISGGLYFFLQGETHRILDTYLHHLKLTDTEINFVIGLSAGALNGYL